MSEVYMYIRNHLSYYHLIMEPSWIYVNYHHGHDYHQEMLIKPYEEE